MVNSASGWPVVGVLCKYNDNVLCRKFVSWVYSITIYKALPVALELGAWGFHTVRKVFSEILLVLNIIKTSKLSGFVHRDLSLLRQSRNFG